MLSPEAIKALSAELQKLGLGALAFVILGAVLYGVWDYVKSSQLSDRDVMVILMQQQTKLMEDNNELTRTQNKLIQILAETYTGKAIPE